MKVALCLALVATVAPLVPAATSGNPMSKVIELLSSLEAKVVAQGEAEVKAFGEFADYCDDTHKETTQGITTAKSQKARQEATIDKATADIARSTSEVEELAAAIATAEKDLAEATALRKSENADFATAEKELMASTDTLGRAINVLAKEMAKNPALVQVDVSDAQRLVRTVSAVLDAAAFSAGDQKRLVALLQSQQKDKQADQAQAESQEDDADALAADETQLGAPAAAAYKTHSTSIVDVLEDLKDKAEDELSSLRKSEEGAQHKFNKLRQSLTDQKAADSHDMGEAKEFGAQAAETKASAEGDLASTNTGLGALVQDLETLHSTCMQVASDHEQTVRDHTEELQVLAKAKKVLEDTSGGAVGRTYSLLQVKARSRSDTSGGQVVSIIERLARQQKSVALTQLASRVQAVIRLGGKDPYGKVRGLISNMIAKLEQEAAAEATEKAYCDEQMAKTEAKKSDLEDEVSKLAAKLDKAVASSAALKEEVRELEADLQALANEQAKMDRARTDEKAAFEEAKADLDLGISGVQKAITVLSSYYGEALVQESSKHAKATGAGTNIIGILEVVEADFSRDLAQASQNEADAAAAYDKMTQENKVVKATKQQDLKYKEKAITSLSKTIRDVSGDKDSVSTEFAAVNEYYAKVQDRCTAVPEAFADRNRRREEEIAGLKEALGTLESETVLVQLRRNVRR